VFVCEVEEGCKLAIKLHPELSILWLEPDLFDELTDAFRGLQACMLVIEGSGEVEDLLAVELGKVRVKTCKTTPSRAASPGCSERAPKVWRQSPLWVIRRHKQATR
jgi:hypothetical protein